jgi:hypothetical protein
MEAPPNTGGKPHPDQENHNSQCRAGVARTAIHCGDIRRGVSIAADMSSSRQLKRECADILEGMKVSIRQKWKISQRIEMLCL